MKTFLFLSLLFSLSVVKAVSITSCSQLNTVTCTGTYTLSNDIDCSSSPTCCSSCSNFVGVFDGSNFTIYNLKCSFFQGAIDATIRNLNFFGVTTTNAILFSGTAFNTLIQNVHVLGNSSKMNMVWNALIYSSALLILLLILYFYFEKGFSWL